MSASTSPKIVTVVDDYDLTLVIGPKDKPGDQTHFRVSSYTLKLTSKVWKVMLTGPFAEKDKKLINFPEDQALGFDIILHLAHLQFDKVPEILTADALPELAEFCDKHDVAHMIKKTNLAARGLEVLREDLLVAEVEELPARFLVFDMFADYTNRDYVVSRWAMEAVVLEKDRSMALLKGRSGEYSLEKNVSRQVAVEVYNKRLAILDSFFKVIQRLDDELMSPANPTCRSKYRYCRATAVGIFKVRLTKFNLYPFPKSTAEMLQSPKYYFECFQGLTGGFESHFGSETCNFWSCIEPYFMQDKMIAENQEHTPKGFAVDWFEGS